MKKKRFRILPAVFLFCIVFPLLLRGCARMNCLILRQYVRIAGEIMMAAGLTYFAFRLIQKIPREKKTARALLAVLAVTVLWLGAAVRFFFETDRESVVVTDGEKKIRVESAFFLFYGESYYEYGGPVWYRAYPRVQVSYDDGDPDQWIYTDYYDENGTLTERVFPDGEEW